MTETPIAAGAETTHYKGRTRIRQVRVVEVHGETATVLALNGILAGIEYEVPLTALSDGGVCPTCGRRR